LVKTIEMYLLAALKALTLSIFLPLIPTIWAFTMHLCLMLVRHELCLTVTTLLQRHVQTLTDMVDKSLAYPDPAV
jgi:hypothetical protein